jgi:SAM-dependent methyltransferase
MTTHKKEVSKLDIDNLKIIRDSVKEFIAYCAEKYDVENALLLDVAPQIHEGAKHSFRKASVKTLDIDPLSGADFIIDICKDNRETIPSETFDFIVCTEVLEHTLQPFEAVREIHRILKNRGLIFLTVPFNFRIHGPLPDCWRFTEHGLRALFAKFEIIELTEIESTDRFLMPIHYRLIAQKKNIHEA